jgi:hypothetical protein
MAEQFSALEAALAAHAFFTAPPAALGDQVHIPVRCWTLDLPVCFWTIVEKFGNEEAGHSCQHRVCLELSGRDAGRIVVQLPAGSGTVSYGPDKADQAAEAVFGAIVARLLADGWVAEEDERGPDSFRWVGKGNGTDPWRSECVIKAVRGSIKPDDSAIGLLADMLQSNPAARGGG